MMAGGLLARPELRTRNMILNPQQMSGWLHLKKSDISIRENYVCGCVVCTRFAVTGTGAGGAHQNLKPFQENERAHRTITGAEHTHSEAKETKASIAP